MKQKIPFPGLLVTLAVAIVFTSCTKTGQIGLQGPQGPQGNPGATGSQGNTGTANVIYSEWDSSFTGTSVVWSVPAITQGVLDSAVILVYVKQETAIFQLPYDNLNGSGFYLNDLMFVGQIQIYCSTGYTLKDFAFRYVIIPGGVAANYVHKDYQEISTLFKLTP
jgi:hypothetical protein